MAEEGYGLQISIKMGDHMFNARGSDADEIVQIINGLRDLAEKDETAQWIVESFKIGEELPKEKSYRRSSGGGGGGYRSKGGSSSSGEPSEKQLDFAKKLGIRNASRMSRSELSEAIDSKLASRDEDDDEE